MQPTHTTTLTAANVLARTMGAFQNGDIEMAGALMHPDIEWHSPGESQPAAGTHHGREQVLAAFGTIAAQPGQLTLDVLDVLSGSEYGGLLYKHRREREDGSLCARVCLMARVSEGQLIEVWEHIYDTHTFDHFYSVTHG
jgi:uncharacterized protein